MTPQQLIIANCILIGENVINVFIDAYKIKRALKKEVPKAVRHGINFGVYMGIMGLCIWLFKMDLWLAVVFGACAFFKRQIWFDIPLNWRRGLKWDYVSLDKPPKAITDRIEIALFGYNGAAPTVCYGMMWIALLITQFII